jgi:hypothetical protein
MSSKASRKPQAWVVQPGVSAWVCEQAEARRVRRKVEGGTGAW